MVGLKKIRKKHRWSQQKVAMDLNISRECLSYYENGKREPSLSLLIMVLTLQLIPLRSLHSQSDRGTLAVPYPLEDTNGKSFALRSTIWGREAQHLFKCSPPHLSAGNTF